VRGANEWMGSRGNLGAALIFAGVIISEIRLGRRRRAQVGHEDAEEAQEDISIDEEMSDDAEVSRQTDE
jgi:hypothetical protein